MTAATTQPEADAATERQRLGEDFVTAAEQALASGRPADVSNADLERVMTAAVRLYAAKADTEAPPSQPVAPELVTPTEIVVTASDLIRTAGLNLWDVSMWFNRTPRR